MRKLALGLVGSLVFLGVSWAAPQKQTFNGEITDSACAKMGSHQAMMQKMPAMKTAKDCTLGCVKAGSKFVLYDAATKTVYELDDQKKPEQFAGAKVKVSGTLDKATNTIHVANIQAAS